MQVVEAYFKNSASFGTPASIGSAVLLDTAMILPAADRLGRTKTWAGSVDPAVEVDDVPSWRERLGPSAYIDLSG
ncbi:MULTISPECIES: hypothetical protein [unclassified Mesorhizobium]|uniref:hypothetical protein n=1 Tax=unclassified Mesorhizobium TaxID=325217 RepID=UPI00167693A5|nr:MULTISPECIES: hypothetical protein [unclassified Mesorhizobium]